MGKRHRERRPARRLQARDPRPVILVVTEGKVTEKEYLDGFVNACRNPRVHVQYKPGAGVPRTFVQYAKDRKTPISVGGKSTDILIR
jgi:hypothetical protein